MKKMCYKFGTALATIALLISVTASNQVCGFFIDQPTLPESVKGLRKF